MGSFTDRGVIIVGAFGAIGQQLALAAAAEGACVVCNVTNLQQDATGPEQSMSGDDGQQAIPEDGIAGTISTTRCDLTTESNIEAFFDSAVDQLGAFHALIVLHDCVLAGQSKPLADLSLAEWHRDMTLYLRRPFFLLRRACEEFLVGGEGGRIVSVLPAAQAAPGRAGYIICQAALHSFQRSIVKEYGPRGVACNRVLLHERDLRLANAPPADRVGETKSVLDGGKATQSSYDAIVRLILFLASDEASYVNGESFHLASPSLPDVEAARQAGFPHDLS